MEDNNMQIRKVSYSDANALLKLHDAVWPQVDYDKNEKIKFVLKESSGVGYCAEMNGELVGSHLSIFQNFYWGKNKLTVVETGDTCVHPSYQGFGIFQKIYNAFRRDFFDNEKGEMIWGISAPGAVRSFTKAGKQFINTTMILRRFCQPFSTLFKIRFNIRELTSPLTWDKSNNVEKIDPALLEQREICFNQNQRLHIQYDNETFLWRIKSNSGIKSFFVPNVGYLLYKIGYRKKIFEIEIGEIFLYKYNLRSLRKLLREFNKAHRPDIMWVIISEGHPLRKLYGKSCFIANPKKKYLPHCVLVEKEELKGICYNPQNWAISSIDIDTF